MKISVLGCGRWGTFLAWYSAKQGHDVTLWGRTTSSKFNELKESRKNEYLELLPNIELNDSLEYAIEESKIIIISISAQNLRSFAKTISAYNTEGKTFVLCMKGMEADSGKRLSQVFTESFNRDVNLAVWLGPGHVQDYVKGIPNCMVITSENLEITKYVVNSLGSKLIRFYYGEDMIGNEIGAAAKNVVGIAAGMLDGLNLSSLKGALMARGTREISRLITAMGGNGMTAYGLCHLGDYEATLFSQHSNNRMFGEIFVTDKQFKKLAEGVATLKAMRKLSETYNVDLPICDALYAVIHEGKDPQSSLENLFLREIKFEF